MEYDDIPQETRGGVQGSHTGEVLSVLEELETPGTEYLNITLKDDEGWKLDVYENGFVEFYELNYDTRVVSRIYNPH